MSRLLRFAFAALLLAAAIPSFAADAPSATPVTFSWSSLPAAPAIDPPPPPPPVPGPPRSGFEGVLSNGPGTDVSLATGENAIMVAAHGRIAIAGAGGSNRSEVNARDFFGLSNGTITGTQCFYDPGARVWWVVGHWSPPGDLPRTLMIAHSTSPNPRGTWGLTSWETATIVSRRTTAYGAEPIAAIAPGRFIVVLRHFVVATGRQDYESVLVFDRTVFDRYYGYAPPVELRITAPPRGGDAEDLTSTRPATCLDATADEVPLVTSRASGGSRVTLRRITGPPDAPVLSAAEVVNVAPYTPAPGARQRGTLRRLQTGDCRVRSAVVRDGVLSAAWHEAGRSSDHTASGIRVLQVRLRDRAVLSDLAYGASRTFSWAPSLTTDAPGTLRLGYVRSAADEFPSVWTATRRPGAAQFEDAVLARAGETASDSLDWSGPSAAAIGAWSFAPGLTAWVAAPYSRTANVRGVWAQPLLAEYAAIEGAVFTNCGSDAPSPADRLPASGRTVTLMRGNRTIATAFTDARGTFAFDGLESGTYDVIASIPPGGAAVEAIAGNPETETVTGANSVRVTITSARSSTGIQFVLADPRPLPQIASLSPAFAWAGAATCTLTVHGSDFVPCTSVRFGSLVRDARYVNSTQLRVVLGAADLVNPGPRSVRAYNPEPEGGLSASVFFDVRTPDTQAPAVTLLAPVGGERWPMRDTRRIAWTAADDRGVASVSLAYSTDGGATFAHTIAAAIPDSGHFDWTLPDTGAAALRVRVTVRDEFGNIAADSSRAEFAVPVWTILASATGPGTMLPSGVVRVLDGDAPEFAMVADSNSYLARLRVNDVVVTPTPSYRFAPVHADQTIAADFGPRTYTWASESGTANFGSPGSWSPARIAPAADDVLQFANGGIVTATNVPNQILGQLRILNGTVVTLQTPSAGTLTLGGGRDQDLWIEAGSQLTLTAPSGAVTIALGAGATGRVDGLVAFGTGNQRLVAQDAGALHFVRGSLCTIGSTATGSVFGTGAGASALGSVVFEAGATLSMAGGGDPFGAAAPNSVLRLEHGSRFLCRTRASAINLSGRTLGDFEFAAGTSLFVAGTAPVQMDSLIVTSGALWMACVAPLTLRGDVRVKAGASLSLGNSDLASPVRFAGDSPQRLTNSGTFQTPPTTALTFDNPAGLSLGSSLTWAGSVEFLRGLLHTGPYVLELTGSTPVAGASASTGWVDGMLRLKLPSGPSSKLFPVGTAVDYSPLQLTVTQLSLELPLTVSCAAVRAPGLVDAPVDTAHVLNRHWTLSSPSRPASLDYTASMTYVPGDLSEGTAPSDLSPFQFSNAWSPRAGGATPGNTIIAQHCTTLGVLTAAKAWFRDYAVTVTVDGPGTVTRSPDQATYAYGDIVTLTAQATAPAAFVGWSGDTSSTLTPLSIAVTRERHLTATFREPVTYLWKNSVSSGLWTDSLNWTPTRGTPSTSDILVFSGSGAVTARGLRSETVAQLLVSGTMQVAFESDSAATITLRGEGGPALSVAAGSRLALSSTSPLTLALQQYATGVIDGRLTLTGAAHRLVARDTSAVTFGAESFCEIGTGESGEPFGLGTGTSGMRSVYFAAGSRLEQSAGGDPFGAAAPNTVIAFLPGSRYVVRGPGVPIALGGRTFADFEYDVPGGQTIATLDAPVTMDSLVVRIGSLYLTQGAALELRGDLTLLGGGVLGLGSIFSGGPIVFRGAATQRITTLGQFYWDATPPLEIDNAAGVVLGSQVRWLGPLRFWHGLLHTGPHAFVLGSTFGTLGADASTGWVVGNLRRRVYNLSTPYAFATGDSTRYAPVTLVFASGSSDFEVTVSSIAGLHPALGSAPVDTARSPHRWWRLSSTTATPANLNYEAILNFAPGELDSSVTMGQLAPMLYNAGWYYPTAGLSSTSSLHVTGVTLYGDLTAGLPLAGPAEPRYTWTAATSRASFTDPGSWTPPRLLRREDDMLEFSSGGADTALDVPTQAIGQLRVTHHTQATLTANSYATLVIHGRPGDDLAVEAGSSLCLRGGLLTNPMVVALDDTANARISGTLEMRDGANRLLGSAPNAIVFETGGACVLTSGFEGNPFGTGAAAGSLGSVRFASGSVLRQSAGGDPFGTQVLDHVVVFDHGSRYRVESNGFTPYLSRRTFADFEVAVPSGLVDVAPTQAFTLDSLIVRQGVLNLTPSGGCTIRGDILVYRQATLNLAPRLGPSSVRLAGDSVQRLIGPGTFATGPYPTLLVDNPHGFTLERDMSWRGDVTFVRGLVRAGTHTLTLDTAAVVTASASTGWVSGKVRRTVRGGNSSAIFDVGSETAYAPVTVTVQNNASDFALTASTEDGDHPDLATSGGDPAKSVNRWWTLLAAGTPSFTTGTAAFTFDAADLDANTAAGSLVPLRHTVGWSQPTVGTRTATSVQATGLTAFGEFALAAPLAPGAAATALAPTADDAPVTAFALGTPSPNPSRGTARVTFALPRESRVRVSVLDVQGREVAVLADDAFAAGRHGVTLAAADRALTPGLYFVRMRVSGGPEFTRRIAVAR